MPEKNELKKPTDLIVGLYLQNDRVLYIKSEKGCYFPSIEMEHGKPDEEKIEQLKSYFLNTLGLSIVSLEAVAHIQKDPRDTLQFFLDSHIFIYRVYISPETQTISTKHAELDFLEPGAGQEKLFTFKSRLLIEFIKAWKYKDYQILDSKYIWEWYNKWKKENILKTYKKYVDEEIEECRTGAGRLTEEIENITKQLEISKENSLDTNFNKVFKESKELDQLISKTAESIEQNVQAVEARVKQEHPELQISALENIKIHLCTKLYNLNKSHLTEIEKRIAYRLMGHLLKKTTDLLDNYKTSGALPEYNIELKKLVYELESENLSPFDKRE